MLLLSLGMLNLTACGGDPSKETGNPGSHPADNATPVKLLASTATGSIATFTGGRADYNIVVAGSEVSIFDKYSGSVRKMSNPTRLLFSDGAVAFDLNGPAGKAYRLYQAAFNRTPDLPGLGYWIDQLDKGVSIESIAAQFVDSAEFRAAYGANPSNREVIGKFYRNVLHREPEQSGFNFWLNVLDTRRASVHSVLVDFGESPENQSQVAAAIANGIEYQAHKTPPAPLPPLPAGVYGVAPFSLNDFTTYVRGASKPITNVISAIGADGSATLTEIGIGTRRDYTIGANHAMLTYPNTGLCHYVYSPGLLLMPVEVQAGQRFKLPTTTKVSSCGSDWFFKETTSGIVSGPEIVKVKAGTFSALRIDISTDQFLSFENQTATAPGTFWRDTVTGLIVKRATYLGDEELVSYSQASTDKQFLGIERMLGLYTTTLTYYGECGFNFTMDLLVNGRCGGEKYKIAGTFNADGDFTATVTATGAKEAPFPVRGRMISPLLILGSINTGYANGNFRMIRY